MLNYSKIKLGLRAIVLSVLFLSSAYGAEKLSLKATCGSDELAVIEQPKPIGDAEFEVNVRCAPATCYYMKQEEFPRSMFFGVWMVVRESGKILGQPGGTGPRQKMKYLVKDINDENEAEKIAWDFVAKGICRTAKYSVPFTEAI